MRLSREELRLVLACIINCKWSGMRDNYRLVDLLSMGSANTLPPKLAETFKLLVKDVGLGSGSKNTLVLKDLIDKVVEHYRGSNESGQERAVVDKIYDIVFSSNARYLNNGQVITQIRAALTSPKEAEVFLKSQAKVGFTCKGCGRELTMGEPATIGSEATVYCSNCLIPTVAICKIQGCDDHVELGHGNQMRLRKIFRGLKCRKHFNTDVKSKEKVELKGVGRQAEFEPQRGIVVPVPPT